MDLDKVYKSQLPISHEAGLRAVFQAGVDSTASAPEVPEPVAPEAEPEVTE